MQWFLEDKATNWAVRVPYSTETKSKEMVTLLAGVIDPKYQWGNWLIHSGGKEDSWNPGDSLGILLVLPGLILSLLKN